MEQYYSLLWVVFFLLLAGGGILLLSLSYYRKIKTKPRLPYIAVPILTESERRFFMVLVSALPKNCYLLAQVRLANLVTVQSGTETFRKYFNPIAMKCVDFVVCRRDTMAPLLVVELDDRSHERVERQERDRFVDEVLSSVGLPILHWPTQARYNATELWRAITTKTKAEADKSTNLWAIQ